MFHAKNYLNRPMFHGVIQKITLAQFFFETLCIYKFDISTGSHDVIIVLVKFLLRFMFVIDMLDGNRGRWACFRIFIDD